MLVYYDPVQVFPLDIDNDTVVIFDPLMSEYLFVLSKKCKYLLISYFFRFC